MTEQTIVAMLSLIGTLGAAGITTLGVIQVRQGRRLKRVQRENHALWYYTRHLIDWGYKQQNSDPPPAPPEHIKHLYSFEDIP